MTGAERREARARTVRATAAVRAWRYRQRHLAGGAWYRLRRVLSNARAIYAIAAEDAERLVSEGHWAAPCGRDFSPERTIVFVDETRLSQVASRRPLPVGLGPDVLAAPALALVPFDEGDRRP
jgi:hypothetical protein